jgi:sugar-specific transcriptional regulator TrmB
VPALEKSIVSGRVNTEAQRSILNGLRDLGLTTYEAQAYLALVQNPDISATQLCNKTGVPDSKIYFALEELQRKGLVVVSEGVPRHYRALAPKEALGKLRSQMTREYETQVEKLNQLSLTLEPLYTRSEREDVELAYIVKGFDNVLSRMIDVLKSAKREVVILVPNLEIFERVEPHLDKIRRSGVKVKLAIPPKLRKQIDTSRFADVRELTPNCMDSWLAIADGKTVISSSEWRTERCHAILTQDPVLVAMSREYFESPRCCVYP